MAFAGKGVLAAKKSVVRDVERECFLFLASLLERVVDVTDEVVVRS
jgi:hypothetical protein